MLIARTGRRISPVGNVSNFGFKNSVGYRVKKGIENLPCIQAPASGPWRPTWRSSRQSTARQRQPRPIKVQHQYPHRHACHHQPINATTYNSEVLERPGSLNVLERLLEVLEGHVDLVLGSFGVLDGLNLEGVDGLELARDVVGGGLEGGEALLDLVDDGLVLEDGAVVGKVDLGRLLGQLLNLAPHVVVALLESLERGGRLATETQGRGDLGPVDLESCASLFFLRGSAKLARAFSGVVAGD